MPPAITPLPALPAVAVVTNVPLPSVTAMNASEPEWPSTTRWSGPICSARLPWSPKYVDRAAGLRERLRQRRVAREQVFAVGIAPVGDVHQLLQPAAHFGREHAAARRIDRAVVALDRQLAHARASACSHRRAPALPASGDSSPCPRCGRTAPTRPAHAAAPGCARPRPDRPQASGRACPRRSASASSTAPTAD